MTIAIGRTHSGADHFFSESDRRRHVHVIGQTGTGKSVLYENMIAADLENGEGVAVFDPHGDLAERVAALVPSYRAHELVYFDASDLERPIGFNVLDGVRNDRRATVTDDILSAFIHLWGPEAIGPRSQQVLRNSLRALLDAREATLLCIPKLLTDPRYRAVIAKTIKDPYIRSYWTDQFAGYDDRKRDDVISPLLNKLDAFLSAPVIRNILGQPKSTINLRKILDERRILIVRLAKGEIGENNTHLLGALLTSALANAAFSRADTIERPLFFAYFDEFQSFATQSFALILSESRKYGVALTLANQMLSQLPDALRDAVLGNSGSFLSFRLGADDAPLVAAHLGLKNPDALKDLPNFQLWGRFLEDGTPSSPTNISTYISPEPTTDRAARMIENSRIRFGRARAAIEERITRFLEGATPAYSQRW
jgi:type IV secretory pathway TraG/TraD family ATPase VirD4